jgi:hypothetical protein
MDRLSSPTPHARIGIPTRINRLASAAMKQASGRGSGSGDEGARTIEVSPMERTGPQATVSLAVANSDPCRRAPAGSQALNETSGHRARAGRGVR